MYLITIGQLTIQAGSTVTATMSVISYPAVLGGTSGDKL